MREDRKEGTWRETQSKHRRSTHGVSFLPFITLFIFERQEVKLGLMRNFQAQLRPIN